jgi:hypothetical protein
VVSWIALINFTSWNMGLYLLMICTMQLKYLIGLYSTMISLFMDIY